MNFQDPLHCSGQLSKAGNQTFEAVKASVSYLRPAVSKKIQAQVEKKIRAAEKLKNKHIILNQATRISSLNWSLLLPFFDAAQNMPTDNHLVVKWVQLALKLAAYDIDTAITFFTRTPNLLESLDKYADSTPLLVWGQQGLDTFKTAKDKNRIWKSINAYLIESSEPNCAFPLERWQFFLDQAVRICVRSMDAAHGFIQTGHTVCTRLNDVETIQWVDKGLKEGGSEQEVTNYFKGISLKAMETGDILISGVALKDKRNILSIICEALLGQVVELRSNSSLLGCDGFTGAAATDGQNIFLPDRAPSFGLYKLLALHQAMLVRRYPYIGLDGTELSDPRQIHLDADERLVRQLPRLTREMDKFSNDPALQETATLSKASHADFKPWWGDILSGLLQETDDTMTWIQDKACETYEDIPPEMVEALISSLLAGGEREPDELWKMLGEMLDNIEFLSPDAEELKENVKLFFYKEWDRKIADYKLDWCQVRQRSAPEHPNDFVLEVNERLRGIILLIRKQFMKLKPEMFRKYKAQPTGDSLDIDALVEALTDMHSGAAMSENVYIRRDKKIRDVSVFFLVDLSGSTDEKVNGQRVIDIQKEAMVIMAEALEALGDPYAIYGFSSEGRFRVDMFKVKDFEEPYDENVQFRLGNLEPEGLTRMGTVIRHAASKLEEITSAIKLMVILTDGRPYDMEYGNLEYAISDTKKAIQEARSKQIHPFIITSDKKGSDYLQMISPQTECVILPKVELLPTLLPNLYKRLTG